MNIRYVENLNSNNGVSAFRLNLNRIISSENEKNITVFEEKIDFNVGDNVKHKLENIFGCITFICDDYTSIKWDDNSKEKFTKQEMIKYIELNDQPKEVIKEEKKIDIEKVELQRKVDQIEKNDKDKLVKKVKTKAASEIVELAISKGMIDNDDREIELQTLSMMNDEEYEKYCEEVIEYTNDHQVTSRVESRDDRTEAEKMLDRIKGTSGIIGDFSGDSPSVLESPRSSGGTRNLSDLAPGKIEIGSEFKMPSFEDQFPNILAEHLDKKEAKKVVASQPEKPTNSLGFKNLQGLTKPIQIPADQSGGKVDFNSFFNSLDWSINK